MKDTNGRKMAGPQKAAVETELAGYPVDFPMGLTQCSRAIEEAYRTSALDFRTILSRFLWLTDPRRKERGIHLLEHFPSITAEELARHIAQPRDVVLAVIQKKTGLDSAFLASIYEAIRSKGHGGYGEIQDLADERVLQEMRWWLVDLKFPEYYLRTTPAEAIALQIITNRSFELQGTDSEAYARMKVSYVSADGSSLHWVHRNRSLELEAEIEREYYRTGDLLNIAAYAPLPDLLLYIVGRNQAGAGTELRDIAPRSFTALADGAAMERYRKVRGDVLSTGSIAMDRSFKKETGEHRLMLGFPRGMINHFAANITRVAARNKIEVTRKYTVTFGGPKPVIISSLYARSPFPEDILTQLVEVGLYPGDALSALVETGAVSPREANFLHAAVLFVHQFISVPDADIGLLSERFRSDPEMRGILRTIQTRMDKDNFTLDSIVQVFVERPDIAKDLYALFASRFEPGAASAAAPGAAIAAAPGAAPAAVRGRVEEALRSLSADQSEAIRWALLFVDSVERTNFYLPVKTALSFRIPGRVFGDRGWEVVPYGVFFIVGRSFHGFHIRFKDIARGGVRLVRSGSRDDYLKNSDFLFEECFNLANTQNKKNKDIPEGGSKGVILLPFGASKAEGEECFRFYVDALLDLLLPGHEAEIRGWSEEILFLGPDEGSADLMDWACERARDRGYRFWKAFSTGKAGRLGGVSHKDYGMTTSGVHRYVLGILKETGTKEESVTKLQTGGPDGDLGSNEILLSKDRTIALSDGGGVLYDPAGLDRTELTRLARAGEDSSHFDEKKLGKAGFKVTVKDKDKKLPDGTTVVSGLSFRNTFYLDPRARADLFVPCGGRPKSINLTNWKSLLDDQGKPAFRWIVEGANLFITQEARLRLEEKGVVLFKDSSTNKGGVISSAFEVLAGLALTDEEFDGLMTVKADGNVPGFRSTYVQEILDAVKKKADLEFGLLWRTWKETGTPLSTLSESVSERINAITLDVERSSLFENPTIRRNAIALHVPPVLAATVGLDKIMERVPEAYQRAICARSIASGFVYRYGITAGFEDYRRFIEELSARKA